ncbi:MAG: lytic transglycosylase domain-containing protein [Microthrixaceae bacterium]
MLRRPLPLLTAAAAVLLIATALPGGATSAGTPGSVSAFAAALTPAALAAPSPDLPGLPPISPELARVEVDGVAYRRARSDYDAAAGVLAQRQSQRTAIDHALADNRVRTSFTSATLAAARARAAGVRSHLDAIDAAIADLAVSLYVSGGAAARIDAALATPQPSINDADRRDVLGTASLDVLLAERVRYRARLADATRSLRAARATVGELRTARTELEARRPSAVAAERDAAAPTATERVALEAVRAVSDVRGTDFSLVALDAYYRAAGSRAAEDPRCGIQWWAVAGVARVEGHHGTYGGARLDARGDATKRIIGIQLNGTNDTQIVRDTDDGVLDGDPDFDRAVGPMQFIPQTWSRFALDGNDDGITTPFNLYDAARTASRYLCRASRGLDADRGLRVAYFSYNHSELYVANVLGFARRYERVLRLPDPPH